MMHLAFIGALVAPSTGKASWSLPLSLALLADPYLSTSHLIQTPRPHENCMMHLFLGQLKAA